MYRMEQSGGREQRVEDPEMETREKERRKSDFLSRYEELTCRAALAIKSVDQLVKTPDQMARPPDRRSLVLSPPSLSVSRERGIVQPAGSLQSPLTPDVEFDEEEVLRTCQDFLEDYNRRERTPPQQPQPPVPAPRHSLLGRQTSPAPSAVRSSPGPTSAVSSCSPTPSVLRSSPAPLSREDEQLLAAAQGKSFWESQDTVFDKIDNVNPEVFDSKIIRTRSSR